MNVAASTASNAPKTASSASDSARSRLSLRAVIEASLIAGAVFLVLEVVASAFGAASPMGPARASLKGLLGWTPGQLTAGQMAGTLAVHFGLALVTTLALGLLVHRLKTHIAVLAGFAFGGILYTANTVALGFFTPATLGIGLAIIVNYLAYGALAGWIYKRRQHALRA